MMRKLNVLIYDDDAAAAKRFEDKVRAGTERISKQLHVEPIPRDKFHEALKELKARQKALRQGGSLAPNQWHSVFDQCDMLVLDYDLSDIDSEEMILTGEVVSYYARVFSRCGLIISVNQYRGQTFDLTLQNHPESWAELNINDVDLANRGLWEEHSWPVYRPWAWPVLPKLARQFPSIIGDVEANLEAKICDFLDFPKAIVETFPRDIGDFVGDPSEVTFEGIANARLNKRDEDVNHESKARVAASVVYKWLEWVVLPGQHILVDPPHLVLRYPSLLKGDSKKISTWNSTSVLHHWALDSVNSTAVKGHQFSRHYWLSRAAWWAEDLSGERKIREVEEPWTFVQAPFVFAEDTSQFHREQDCREFVAAPNSPFSRRHVRKPPGIGVRYEPEVRFVIPRVA